MILDEIVNKKKMRIDYRKKQVPIEEIKELALSITSRENRDNYKNLFMEHLSNKVLSVIGEFKKASPSKGIIVDQFNVQDILNYYLSIGVDAFSILTEEDFFMGSDEYLKEIRAKSNLPILRKDFIIDFYQIYESKILGADAILLIVSVLKDKLGEFYNEAKKLNLQALVEVHNQEELDIALKCGCDVIGINNRDLNTFNVSLDNTKKLIQSIPKDKIIVSESGIKTIEDLRRIKSYGANAVLIGELFMRNIENTEFQRSYKDFKVKV